MTYVKLEDAVKAVAAVQIKYDDGESIPALCVQVAAVSALRALPVSDGWEDIATCEQCGKRVCTENAEQN